MQSAGLSVGRRCCVTDSASTCICESSCAPSLPGWPCTAWCSDSSGSVCALHATKASTSSSSKTSPSTNRPDRPQSRADAREEKVVTAGRNERDGRSDAISPDSTPASSCSCSSSSSIQREEEEAMTTGGPRTSCLGRRRLRQRGAAVESSQWSQQCECREQRSGGPLEWLAVVCRRMVVRPSGAVGCRRTRQRVRGSPSICAAGRQLRRCTAPPPRRAAAATTHCTALQHSALRF
jgi:hypothetical protein